MQCKQRTRLIGLLCVGLLWGAVTVPRADAECIARSTELIVTAGKLYPDLCPRATAAAPSWTEGAFPYPRVDLSGNSPVTLGTLISGEDQTNNLLMTSGGVVRTTTVASAITTNTTSAAATVPIGSKTFAAVLTGTGAITQTLAIYGSVDNTYTAAVDPLICTITLSGTTAVGDACAVATANFAYYFVVSTNTTGTSASGVFYAMY